MTTALPAHRGAQDRPLAEAPAVSSGAGIDLQVDYSRPGVAVITIAGVVDDASLPRLAELLQQRLASLIDVLVMDLSAVAFISVSGLELLRNTLKHADARGIAPQLVASTHVVRHALRTAGLHETPECHGSLTEALATPFGTAS